MKINSYMTKIEHLEKSVDKLDDSDYEILVEAHMLISAHHINASLHKLDAVRENKDIKHNQPFSFLKCDRKPGPGTEEIRDCMKKIDDLRPSHVYGKVRMDILQRRQESATIR